MAPISGRISDKVNPKIPIILGILLMAFSFYLNSKLSFLTERKALMASLYVRAFGMGLTFTAMNTISLLEISREKMAQASGISNTIRQLGGSLGVALLATMLTTRSQYHVEQYGLALNTNSEIYQETAKNIKFYAQHESGSSPANAIRYSQSEIMSNINKQGYIDGINDDFLISAIITLIGGIPIVFMYAKKSKNEKTTVHE
ncbi:MAG: MFS transporter [Bacteroidales bacterium]|jgi:DHA2 family multidrug resistance protein